MGNKLVLKAPRLRQEAGRAILSADFHRRGKSDTLWYAVDQKYAQYFVTERLDGFLVALLLLAMKEGMEIELEAPLSERLYYNISHYYQHIMRRQMPELQAAPIKVSSLTASPLPSQRVLGMGFSAGVDSFSAFLDHTGENVSPGYRLTHMVFNNVGSHAPGERGRKLFEEKFQQLAPLASSLGVELIKVDSNLDDLLGMGFQATHTPRNMSVALVLQHLFGKFLYASGQPYEECRVGRAAATAYNDPISLPLLSTETIELIATGSQYTRVEKMQRIVEHPVARRNLNVCTSPSSHGGNCSKCEKCARALLTAEILGCFDEVGKNFDPEVYRLCRSYYISSMLRSDKTEWKEVAVLARERGFKTHAVQGTAVYQKVQKGLSSARRHFRKRFGRAKTSAIPMQSRERPQPKKPEN